MSSDKLSWSFNLDPCLYSYPISPSNYTLLTHEGRINTIRYCFPGLPEQVYRRASRCSSYKEFLRYIIPVIISLVIQGYSSSDADQIII